MPPPKLPAVRQPHLGLLGDRTSSTLFLPFVSRRFLGSPYQRFFQ
jgi:hypothetical protein